MTFDDETDTAVRHPDGTTTRKTLPISPSNRVAKWFCGKCNNGWMSALETRARPVLTPLILGNAFRLRRPDLDTVALWAAKTAITCEFLSPTRLVTPPEHCRWVYENRTPPPGMQIWIAPHVGDLWRGTYDRETRKVYLPKEVVDERGEPIGTTRIQFVTLGIGKLLFSIYSPTNLGLHSLVLGGELYSSRVRQIWPYPRPFRWPPGEPLSDLDATIVSMGLIQRLEEKFVTIKVLPQRGPDRPANEDEDGTTPPPPS